MNARRVAAQTAMELRLLLRNGENLLVTLAIPTGLLVFFTLVPVVPVEGPSRVAFLLPGVVALAVMSAAMVSLGIATGFERSALVLKRLGVTPLRRSELVAAKIAAVALTEAGQLVVLLAVAALLGWRPRAGASASVVAALLLGTACFAGLGLSVAGRARALTSLALLNALYVALLLLSGILFPVRVLPQPLAAVARLLPSTALADALRGVLAGDAAMAALGVLTAWTVAFVVVAAAVFRWE